MRSPQLDTHSQNLTPRRLTQNEQRELQNRMEKKQMKEFMNVCTILQLLHCDRCVYPTKNTN